MALQSNAYRAVLIMTTLTLSFVLGYVPIIGQLASFMFMCWVDA
jgi:etoposide-induced 2.4 mRNA